MNKIKLLNIDKIIQNDTILNDEYLIVQKFEDKISELYKTDNNSEIIDEDLSILYDITENNNYNIKIYLLPDISLFNLEPELLNMIDNFVLGGSYIRSIFVENPNILDMKLELELHLYPLIVIDFEKLSIFDSYMETPTMFYKKVNNYIIYINKYFSKSIGQVLLNNTYIKRCIYHKERVYCSPMFILEYNLNKNFINSDKVDPIFNTKIDLFGLSNKSIKKDLSGELINLINLKDFDSYKSFYKQLNLSNLSSFLIEELTLIEYAIKLFINESCMIIQEQLKLIILDLISLNNFIRPPGFYADMYNLSDIDAKLYSMVCDTTYKEIKDKELKIKKCTDINDINDIIICYYIQLDLDEKFYLYIDFLDKKLSGNIIDYLIEYKPEKIIKYGIKKKLFSMHHIYKIILESEELQHFHTLNKYKDYYFDMNIAMNYIDIIISNNLSKSFYYIYKQDPLILTFEDNEQNTILHKLSEDNFDEQHTFVNLILTLNEDLLLKKNSLGETPLLTHAKAQHLKITNLLLQYIMHNNLYSLLEDIDMNGDSIYHILSKSDTNLVLLKLFIQNPLTKLVINKQNLLKQTPIMLATIHKCENIFYLLQTSNADLSITDNYSNSIYHYICLNEMCIGMAIEDKSNIFGYKPSDYCKISKTYYYFI